MREFTVNRTHPIFEIIEETENHNWFVRIGLREFWIDGNTKFSQLVGGNHICLGIMPDPEHITQTKMRESFKNKYLDHLVGTSLNEYIKRGLCRENLGAFANLKIFTKDDNGVLSKKPNPKSLEILFQLLLQGFPMLRLSSKTDESSVFFRFDSRGKWYTKERKELPELNPALIEIPFARLGREFEELMADAEGDSAAANEAIKVKLLCSFTSMLYNMSFAEKVDEKLLEDPNRVFVVQKPMDMASKLKYQLEKAQAEGRVRQNAR